MMISPQAFVKFFDETLKMRLQQHKYVEGSDVSVYQVPGSGKISAVVAVVMDGQTHRFGTGHWDFPETVDDQRELIFQWVDGVDSKVKWLSLEAKVV